MSDDDLIRKGDALKALDWGDIYGRNAQDAIAALPAVTVGVRPLDWQLVAAKEGIYYRAFDPLYGREVEAPNEATCDAIDANRAARILAALEPKPVPDAAAIREAAQIVNSAAAEQKAVAIRRHKAGLDYGAADWASRKLKEAADDILALITEKPHD